MAEFHWKAVRKAIMDAQNVALCVVRKWWRPAVCIGIAGSILNVGIYLPLVTKQYPDLVGLAALIASAAPFAWFRSQEKRHGVKEGEPE